MFTRKDYLSADDSAAAFHRFYGEIIEAMGGAKSINTPFTNEQVRAAIKDGDEHLNTLPLQSWDCFVSMLRGADKVMRERGDYLTLAGGVCILKEAARLKIAPYEA